MNKKKKISVGKLEIATNKDQPSQTSETTRRDALLLAEASKSGHSACG